MVHFEMIYIIFYYLQIKNATRHHTTSTTIIEVHEKHKKKKVKPFFLKHF